MSAKVLLRAIGSLVSVVFLLFLLIGCVAPTPTPPPTPPDGNPPPPPPPTIFTITESASQTVTGKKATEDNVVSYGWVYAVLGELVLKNGLFYRFIPDEKELEVVGAWADSVDARDIFGRVLTRREIFVSPGGRYIFAIRSGKVDVFKFSETALIQKVGSVEFSSPKLVLYNEDNYGNLAFGLINGENSPPTELKLYKIDNNTLENVANITTNIQGTNYYLMHEFTDHPDMYYLEANLVRSNSDQQLWEGTLSIKKLMPDGTVVTVYTHDTSLYSYDPDKPTRYLTLYGSLGLSEYVNYGENSNYYTYDVKRNIRAPNTYYPVFYVNTGSRGWFVESFYDVNPVKLIDPITRESSSVEVVDKRGLVMKNFAGLRISYEWFDYQRRAKWLSAFENGRVIENIGLDSPILLGSYTKGKIVMDYGAPRLNESMGSYEEIRELNEGGLGATVLNGAVFLSLDGGLFMLHSKSGKQRLRFISLGDTMTVRDGKIWFAGANSIKGNVPVVGYYEPETDRFVYGRPDESDENPVPSVSHISVSNSKIALLTHRIGIYLGKIEIWDKSTLTRERVIELSSDFTNSHSFDVKRFKLTDDGKIFIALGQKVYIMNLRGQVVASADLSQLTKYNNYYCFNADISRDGSRMLFAIVDPTPNERKLNFAILKLSETGKSMVTVNDNISFPVNNMSLIKKISIDKVLNYGSHWYNDVPSISYFNDGRHLLLWGMYGNLATDPLSLMVIDTETEKVSARFDVTEYGGSFSSPSKIAHRSLIFNGDEDAAILIYNTENGEQFYRVFRISK